MEPGGYILLWKRFLETSFYKDSVAVHLAIHLLLKANWEDKTTVFNGKEIIIYRGQLLGGRNQLALSLGVAPSTIRNKLLLLKNVGFLDIQHNNKFSIITICKYENYQSPTKQIRTSNRTTTGQQLDSQRTTTGHILNNYKEVKEKKEKNPPTPLFSNGGEEIPELDPKYQKLPPDLKVILSRITKPV